MYYNVVSEVQRELDIIKPIKHLSFQNTNFLKYRETAVEESQHVKQNMVLNIVSVCCFRCWSIVTTRCDRVDSSRTT